MNAKTSIIFTGSPAAKNQIIFKTLLVVFLRDTVTDSHAQTRLALNILLRPDIFQISSVPSLFVFHRACCH